MKNPGHLASFHANPAFSPGDGRVFVLESSLFHLPQFQKTALGSNRDGAAERVFSFFLVPYSAKARQACTPWAAKRPATRCPTVRCQVTEPELAQELCKALNGISAHTNRADHWYDQARESIDKKCRNQKAVTVFQKQRIFSFFLRCLFCSSRWLCLASLGASPQTPRIFRFFTATAAWCTRPGCF